MAIETVVAVERPPALDYSAGLLFSRSMGSWIPLWNFETIRMSLMGSKCLNLVSLAKKYFPLYNFSSLMHSLLSRG